MSFPPPKQKPAAAQASKTAAFDKSKQLAQVAALRKKKPAPASPAMPAGEAG